MMSDAYLGEIRMFGGAYAPRGWAFCNGQQMMISANPSLYSLLGIVYGGDGRVSFNLPDLTNRVPVGQGTGLGLTPRRLGSMFGSAQVRLTANQLPSHSHKIYGVNITADQSAPNPGVLPANVTSLYSNDTPANTTLSANALADSGGDGLHNNMMFTSTVSYIICVQGLYPQRS